MKVTRSDGSQEIVAAASFKKPLPGPKPKTRRAAKRRWKRREEKKELRVSIARDLAKPRESQAARDLQEQLRADFLARSGRAVDR